MKLIADSGSTKTSWCLIDKSNEVTYFSTIGLNPFFVSSDKIVEEISNKVACGFEKNNINEIFFYGAGCGIEENSKIIFDSLIFIFKNAKINIETDILGAARGLIQSETGIAVILGTGSNCCLYNGNIIVEKLISLGFIFEDYGGGASIGKEFLKLYLKNELQDYLVEKFKLKYLLSNYEILDNIYRKPFPNRFLASMCYFIFENINDEILRNIVKNSFRKYFENNILKLTNYKNQPLYFTGSVAFGFGDLLIEIAKEFDLKILKIIKEPIEGLVKYHKYNL